MVLSRPPRAQTARFQSDVVDVEFEKVDNEDSPKKKKERPVSTTSTSGLPTKTLLDMSLDMDPEFKDMPIPFVDGRSFINCKLAFMVEMDGVNYAIGVPQEHSAAIAISERDGSVVYLSPDDEENVELMQIMASELQKNLGEDLQLKRTPRVLTISGDLGNYTDGWQDKFFEAANVEDLMDDTDEDLDSFHKFMKEELGEEEYQKTMNGEDDDEFDFDEDLLKLFDIPGLGSSANDEKGLEELLNGMLEEDPAKAFDSIGQDLSKEWVALRLVGFNFKDGKAYSLVQMLKPFTLVARQVVNDKGDGDVDIRFELLTTEEQKIAVPKLEELCQQDLEEAGLSLKSP